MHVLVSLQVEKVTTLRLDSLVCRFEANCAISTLFENLFYESAILLVQTPVRFYFFPVAENVPVNRNVKEYAFPVEKTDIVIFNRTEHEAHCEAGLLRKPS